jgi:hypothetical protein
LWWVVVSDVILGKESIFELSLELFPEYTEKHLFNLLKRKVPAFVSYWGSDFRKEISNRLRYRRGEQKMKVTSLQRYGSEYILGSKSLRENTERVY